MGDDKQDKTVIRGERHLGTGQPMARSLSSSGGVSSRSGRTNPPVIDRRTVFSNDVSGETRSIARPPAVKASRYRVSAFVVAALAITSFMAVLVVYPDPVSSLTPRGPIYIASDADFTEPNGVTGGSGADGDPYIISGWDIFGDDYAGIDIEGTTAFFVIRDVRIIYSGGSLQSGVYFYGVSNGTFEDSTVEGIDSGIEVDSCENVTLESNLITGCNYPMYISLADNFRIWNNTISGGGQGIRIDEVFSFDITGNVISACAYEGIYGYYVHDCMFSSNSISDCGGSGIFLDFSSGDCVIFNNTLSGNYGSWDNGGGVFLDGCTGILVYHNSFLGNTPTQAYDFAGTGNSWNLPDPVGGNYWDDYTGDDSDLDGFGDDPYVIAAPEPPYAQDALPLMTQPGTGTPIPEFSSAILPVLAVMALFLVVLRRR